MKNNQDKENFIQLRAQGLSFDKIAKEISTSKPTLLKWDEEFSKEIANYRYIEADTLLSQYSLVKTHRIESLSLLLQKATDALKDRDFSDTSTKDLISIVFNLQGRLGQELENIEYHTGIVKTLFEEGEGSLVYEKTLPLPY
jgi:hypothetical protein